MLIYFVSFISFILFYKYSLPIKPLPSWASSIKLLSFYIFKDFNSEMASEKTKKKRITEIAGPSLLDLPDLALESILEKLEPADLCKMACVSSNLRDICLSDYLWKRHMNQKWGRIIRSDFLKEWQLHMASRKEPKKFFLDGGEGRGILMSYLSKLWPVVQETSSDHGGSIVSCYRALETGKLWVPAQVFNRENGHVGFVMSCYDAELSYDSQTDTFEARYPPHGTRAVAAESGVTWDRLRAPPLEASPHNLLISDCLNDLRPKDHIEIQWRRNKQFPYGWWYGVIGHLESCDGNATYCRCHESDTVVLEFKQYAPGSRWRHMTISRKDHREEGNETEGFYGGIRKLYNKDDISMWQQFWPTDILE